MAGLPITLTDAGRAALVNAQNTGTVALTISQVGVSPTHTAGALTGLAALPGELKRLNTFGGDVVAEDTLHLTIRDESADTYSLRAFGLYLSDGTLFAVYSQAAAILEKSAAAMLLLATDIVMASLTTAMIEFGDTDFINPPATSETPGVVELADQAETNAGDRFDVAVVPGRLKVLLTSLLGGKANTAHTHDAADLASGVLSVLRIPDLAIAKITGLATALAGKADTGHTHDAANITSGVFNALRIPDLAMAKITGLVDALASKAAAAHSHAMADITGLAAALAGKSDNGHGHVMGDISGLVAALAGKAATAHSHAMADIAGLAAALAAKLDAASFTWALLAGKPDLAEKLEYHLQQSGAVSAGWWESPATIGRTITGAGYDPSYPDTYGLALGFKGLPGDGSVDSINGRAFDLYKPTTGSRLYLRGYAPNGAPHPWAQIWTSADFNPADKANLSGAAFIGGVKAPNFSVVGAAGTHREIIFSTDNLNRWNLYCGPGAEAGANQGSDLALGRYGDDGAYIGQSFSISRATGQVSFDVRPAFAGYTPWDSANFNPADKAAAIHSHDWAQITGKPDVVSWNRGAQFAGITLVDQGSVTRGYIWGDTSAVGFLAPDGNWRLKATDDNLFFEANAVQHAGNGASAAEFRGNSGSKALQPGSVWSAAAVVAVVQSATIAVDLSTGLNFSTTMTGNRTLGAPTNAKPGQSGIIVITQDATGGRTLAFDAAWKFPMGLDPVLSIAAGARDVLCYTVIAPGDVVASLLKDVK